MNRDKMNKSLIEKFEEIGAAYRTKLCHKILSCIEKKGECEVVMKHLYDDGPEGVYAPQINGADVANSDVSANLKLEGFIKLTSSYFCETRENLNMSISNHENLDINNLGCSDIIFKFDRGLRQ